MERKEPTLSGIAPDKDEIASRQQRNQRRSERPPTAPPPGPPAAGPGNGLVIFALILAVAGLGGSGFLAWKFYQAAQELAQSQGRIANLEERLNITYDESSESVDAIQEKLDWADSEIRKLWGVAYDTNRKNIAANTAQLTTLQRDLASVRQNADSAQGAVEGLKGSLSELQSEVASLKSAVGSVDEQRKRLQNLEEKLDQVNDQLAQLSSLPDRVATNEEAIAAIDAYRHSINRELLDIKEQLSQ